MTASSDVRSSPAASAEAEATFFAPPASLRQPPRLSFAPYTLAMAIGSLALGGAERIVLDWAARAATRHRVRLLVVRRAAAEWPVPEGVEVIRIEPSRTLQQLESEARHLATAGSGRVLCHLLTRVEREALQRGGVETIPVLHNAIDGWIEPPQALDGEGPVIAVSNAARRDLEATTAAAQAVVIRHLPVPYCRDAGARHAWRRLWAVPEEAALILMIGGVKPQKAYPRALRVLSALLRFRDAHLVIVGGPTGRDGGLAWNAIINQAEHLGLADRVRLPGAIPHAVHCLAAADCLLNTSHHEGLSIATLEALAAGLPVVASEVGGQGEVEAPGLTLIPDHAAEETWAGAVQRALASRPVPPSWRGFPAWRQWTLAQFAKRYVPGRRTVFITANLNAGGAQRSLVNLACALHDRVEMEILVCGPSSGGAFADRLAVTGVRLSMTSDSREVFDHAENIVRRAVETRARNLVFWNVDPKTKLLVAKFLSGHEIRILDVSPGDYAFEEMEATREFQKLIAFPEVEYYARLDRMVLKYPGTPPAAARPRSIVIPNGVSRPSRARLARAPGKRIVMSGRIAPSKFVIEAIQAMRMVWPWHADAELHLIGVAEERNRDYGEEVLAEIANERGRRIFLHGADVDAPNRLAEFDIALVLGHHQGSPNAVLEALAAGVPVVANDSGDTRRMVLERRSGVLVRDCDPRTVAKGLCHLLDDPRRASRYGEAGRRHVLEHYSMSAMVEAYLALLES